MGEHASFAGEMSSSVRGTHATLPDVPGLSESKPLTHIEALELDHIPEHLLVMGGGYIGLNWRR
jgi:pyruvate/2-oxoglutarate dehydrogenase complex dihydrolipoamide dehydrogenase (E3) component